MKGAVVRLSLAVLAATICMGARPDANRVLAPLQLKTGALTLTVNPDSGTFASIADETNGVNLTPPPDMADNFRLTLLRPDKSKLTILGKDQKLTRSQATPGRLSLFWDGPFVDSAGGRHDLALQMDVKTSGRAMTFQLHLQNRTLFKVQEAVYPLIGGLDRFAPDATLWAPTSTPWEKTISSTFGTASFGYPGKMCMSFACIQSKSTGKALSISSQDEVARYKSYEFAEETNPEGEKSLFASIRHMPFTPPGGSFEGSPIAVQIVNGDWRACGAVYRGWFQKVFGIMQPANCWIRQESFFNMAMFMLPEGTINFTFKEIPKWAKAAKECGINAVQISGWNVGGHDNGYPGYTPDPRLGTLKELTDGIRACHRMGMKVYFFVNYGQAMVDSDWYKKELYKYREIGADGRETWIDGWGMGTLAARMGHSKKVAWIDNSFPQFQKILIDDFTKLAQIGADGVHVDKVFPTAIEYNPAITMSPDTASWQGTIDLTKRIIAACRRYQPDWAMSFECNWDRLLQFGDATWWVGNQRITRQVFPEHVETLGLYDAWDFLGVNNAVRDGHVVMVAPFNFSRAMDWKPFKGLGRYIKEVKRIRDSLQDTVFLGEVWGHSGVSLEAPSGFGIEYNVFRNRTTGERVCIVTNSSMSTARVTFDGFRSARVEVPFAKPLTIKLPGTINIPAEGIVFVEEA